MQIEIRDEIAKLVEVNLEQRGVETNYVFAYRISRQIMDLIQTKVRKPVEIRIEDVGK